MILIDGHVAPFGNFPNGERHLNFNKMCVFTDSEICLKYESDQDLMDLFILKRYMDQTLKVGFGTELVILYMPYSRMDRTNDVYTFNLKYICDFINSMGFHRVTVYDAHSDVTMALLNNASNISIIPDLFKKFLDDLPNSKDLVIMYPDAGAQRYAGKFNYPTVVGMKERDFATGNITSFDFYGLSVRGKHVVIIDDLCSKGGTFVGASTALRKEGAVKVSLIVAHCEDTIFDGNIFQYIDKVYTTNSLLKQTLVGLSMNITKLYEVKNDKN